MEVQLLVVDDEIQIRTGIERGIPWKNYGISRVFSAENGIEAMKILQEQEVQILITDIRMPGMTGLELAKKAKECYPEIQIIILSGFSEFEYAKQAISIGVEDYLLKPIKISELTKLITWIMQELEKKYDTRQEQMEQKARKNIEYHLTSGASDGITFQGLLTEYTGYPLDTKIICAAFDYDIRPYLMLKEDEDIQKSILLELCRSEKGMFFLEQGKKIIVFACLDVNRSFDSVMSILKKSFQQINNALKTVSEFSISAGIGRLTALKELGTAVEECLELLDQRLFEGTGLYLDKPVDKSGRQAIFLLKKEEQLRQAVIGYQYDQAEQYVKEQFALVKKLKVTSYDLVKGICLNLKQMLFSYIQETGLDVESVLEKNKDVLLSIPDFLTLDQYQNWILDLYFLVIRGITEHSDKTQSNVIISALAYISTNYSKDITVDSISGYVKKSKNYFSYLFKKEMGVSFVEYLNKYRVEEAKKLLDSSIDLAYEIAQKVGFRDEKYFSMVFKKIVGVSPSAYRKKKGV